ncbi:HNH endonuclease [Dysgonomonas alginatilytica]|nr:HNH endonuclease [Dysgonomonas alginatilytica]
MCGKDFNLEIHHKTYRLNGISIIGKELDHLDCLILLCEDCHQKEHKNK